MTLVLDQHCGFVCEFSPSVHDHCEIAILYISRLQYDQNEDAHFLLVFHLSELLYITALLWCAYNLNSGMHVFSFNASYSSLLYIWF